MSVFWNAIINCGEENVFTCCPIVINIFACLQSWTIVLGHFCISGAFSNPHRSNPHPPHPTNNVGRVYPEFLFRVSSLYRVGGGRTARNFRKGCTVLRGNREMTERYEYCSTVPRTFVQEFLNPGFGKKVCFLHFSYAFYAF